VVDSVNQRVQVFQYLPETEEKGGEGKEGTRNLKEDTANKT
jgi:hypothetical protein